jgi:hypothetical protein
VPLSSDILPLRHCRDWLSAQALTLAVRAQKWTLARTQR